MIQTITMLSVFENVLPAQNLMPWSRLLNALLALYHTLSLDRNVERLREQQTIEDLGPSH
jgi:hypothetical protein